MLFYAPVQVIPVLVNIAVFRETVKPFRSGNKSSSQPRETGVGSIRTGSLKASYS